jgi:type IV pilus assembly protein PilB
MKLPFIFDKKRNSEIQKDQPRSEADSTDGFESETDWSIRGLSDLYCPEESTSTNEPSVVEEAKKAEPVIRDIADTLLDMGALTAEQYQRVRDEQASKPVSDVEALLLEKGLIHSEMLLRAKAEMFELEFHKINPNEVSQDAFGKLEPDFIKSNNVLPISIDGDNLVIATSRPGNNSVLEEIRKRTRMTISVVVCAQEDIDAVCRNFVEEQPENKLDDIIQDMADVEVVSDQQETGEDLEKMAGESPVIKFVNYLISNAIHEGASDIHIEPKEKFTKIRYRIDGILFEIMQSPIKMHPAIVSRIKIMSNLDISERRLPQDGKISVIVGGRGIDLRVSVLPTNRGEKVVIRVLDSKSIMRGLDQLGMEPDITEAFGAQIELPHGILLVTGPTGSGKSTTLYSALSQMDGDKMNVSTVEDPVEYELGFCNQVQVNEKIGMDFASALRSLLRQDPDIIMIGEIRDNETARIAVQAALTGHLVLSTLHTNDAASSITRLVNIGIDQYLIAAALNAVLAQRLVRKICSKCKEAYEIPEGTRKYLEKSGVNLKEVYHGAGCDACRGSGYSGRVGIYELLIIDDMFRDMINKDSSVNNMRRAFAKSKQATLFDDGVKKIIKGFTTIEEVLRVTKVYGQNEEEVFVENIK